MRNDVFQISRRLHNGVKKSASLRYPPCDSKLSNDNIYTDQRSDEGAETGYIVLEIEPLAHHIVRAMPAPY